MKKNNFWLFSLVCLIIVCVASKFFVVARLALGINAVIVLAQTIHEFVMFRRNHNE